jgi:hypothetical protein
MNFVLLYMNIFIKGLLITQKNKFLGLNSIFFPVNLFYSKIYNKQNLHELII